MKKYIEDGGMGPGAFSVHFFLTAHAEEGPRRGQCGPHTDKKANKNFLINKEIQMGSDAKSYMRKDFPIYEEAVMSYVTLHPIPLNFLILYEENFIFFFISAHHLRKLGSYQNYRNG